MPSTAVERLKQRILHVYSVRFHMSLILSAAIACGVLSSRLLLGAGLHSLRLRYPLSVLASYLTFLLLVRLWIWYVSIRHTSLGLPDLDLSGGGFSLPGGGGGSGGPFRFGGGSSGGGGASDMWGQQVSASLMDKGGSSGGGGGASWLPDIGVPDLDLGDDGWWVLLVLVVLVGAILGAGGYLIYAAPHILPDAACQALIAPALLRIAKEDHHGWIRGVLRSTILPMTLVLLLAGTLGWVAHRHCPGATRLLEVLECSGSVAESAP